MIGALSVVFSRGNVVGSPHRRLEDAVTSSNGRAIEFVRSAQVPWERRDVGEDQLPQSGTMKAPVTPPLERREGQDRLRILMLIPELGYGGAQGSFLRLARQLARQADVTIAVMGIPDVETRALPEVGWPDLPIVRLDAGSAGRSKAARWWRMLRRLRALKTRSDVTISFLSGMNLLNALVGPAARTIVSERGSKRHDIGMSPRKRVIWTQILDRVSYWGAGRIVAASEGLAHEIVTANPWAAPRVLAIEGAVEAGAMIDAADLPVEPDMLSLMDHDTVVTFGRLHVQKALDFLLSAFARVHAVRPSARLLLIGTGPEEPRLRKRAAELGLSVAESGAEASVILPGMRSDPLRYLKLGRVFVLPSRYEGLPNALIEALATGIPALAADCPWGPRSILSAGALQEDGTPLPLPLGQPHGVLMPLPDAPGALEVWAQEMERALAAPPRPRPPRDERLAAVARFDIKRTGPRWQRLVEEMAQQAGRR